MGDEQLPDLAARRTLFYTAFPEVNGQGCPQADLCYASGGACSEGAPPSQCRGRLAEERWPMVLQAAGSSINPWLLPGEQEALLWITGHQSPWLDVLLLPVSLAGEWGACWILLIAGLLIWGRRDHRRLAFRLGLTMFLASVLVVLPLRALLPRHRPYQVFPQVQQKGLPLEGSSFPSGHAQSAWLAAVYLGGRRGRFAMPLALFAVLMCYSRVYSGMHYPLDVLVGGMIGVLFGGSLLLLERRKRVEAPTA